MTKTLKENQAFVKALFSAIEERGEAYTYTEETCVYILNGCASCLIGDALIKAGHSHEEILSWDGVIAIGGPNGESANVKMLRMGYDRDISQAARNAQIVQDEHGTWGEAKQAFIDYLVDKDVWTQYDPSTSSNA